MTPADPEVSVVVPIAERPAPLGELYREFSAPLREAGLSFEFVFVTYPWFRDLLIPLRQLATEGEPIRLLEVGQPVGETGLLKVGATQSRGRILCSLPPYRQTEAAVLPLLVGEVSRGADLSVAHRYPRNDSWFNRAQNRFLHLVLRGATGDHLHDVACGVRAFRRDLLAELPLYGDFARFLPLIALREGFAITEVRTRVHPTAMKARVYSPGTYLRRGIDTLGLLFLTRFTDKPLRLFGLAGLTLGSVGAVILIVVLVQRLGGQGLADRPLLLLGVLLVTVGVQVLALGLIGELIVYVTASKRKLYRLEREKQEPDSG